MTTAVLVIAIAAVLYASVIIALWHFQERIVFQPPTNPESTHRGSAILKYASGDGTDLVAHVVEPDGVSRAVVLAFHGNAVTARWMIPWARELSQRCTVTVVLPEYRGYDGLAGTPTYAGAALDARAALQATAAHFGMEPGNVVLYGHSLGTAVAVEVASAIRPRAIILESPFSSARDMAARWRIFGLDAFWMRISRVHYDTAERVRSISAPVHVAHGVRDIIIPSRMGETVYAAAQVRGKLLVISDAGHNDVAASGGDAYWHWMEEALGNRPQ